MSKLNNNVTYTQEHYIVCTYACVIIIIDNQQNPPGHKADVQRLAGSLYSYKHN